MSNLVISSCSGPSTNNAENDVFEVFSLSWIFDAVGSRAIFVCWSLCATFIRETTTLLALTNPYLARSG